MTIGTAIVVSVAIICVAFVTVCALGAWLTVKKQKINNTQTEQSRQLTQAVIDNLSSKIKNGALKK